MREVKERRGGSERSRRTDLKGPRLTPSLSLHAVDDRRLE